MVQGRGGDEEVEQAMANLSAGTPEFPPDDCCPPCHRVADAQDRYAGQELAELLFSTSYIMCTQNAIQ